MTLVLLVILAALAFTYINGFHDTANSIATVVSTKVLTPRQAIVLAAVTNLGGAFFGQNVAKTVASGLVDAQVATMTVVLCALAAAIFWGLLTWWFGLPSSSSHALVGGLCGSAVAAAQGRWSAIIWSVPNATHWYLGSGILWKVIVPMILSPLLGLVGGFFLMSLLYFLLRNWTARGVNRTFGVMQLFSAGYMGWAHGMNDAQKTMGILTLALVAGTTAGNFDALPAWLSFLKTPAPVAGGKLMIPAWITVVCALTMCAGTAAGGWRIIRTLGHKMVRIKPVQGFAAETTGATVLAVAAHFGMPVSTTHAITTSIMGVGCAKGFNHLNLHVVERIIWAWVLTLPAAGLVGYLLVRLALALGWM